MKYIFKLSLLLGLFLLTGCPSPKPDAMKRDVHNFTLPKLPKKGHAIVYIVRPANLGAIIKFNVFVDNKEKESEVGYTKGNEYIYFYLSEGNHQILSKAKNWAKLDLAVKENEVIFIEQKPSTGFPLPSNTLVKIVDYEGKYQVKHLKLGTIF